MQFSSTTTAQEVATAFQDDIRGKNVLITGTSLGGIGFDTALAIAKYANLLIITGHNSDRLKAAEDALKQQVPTANIRTLILDLSSLAAVRKAAAEVNEYPEPLNVLIHNAAAPISETFKLTTDNLESQMATDHIAPFLLTKLLTDKLLSSNSKTSIPRVVFVSSSGHSWIQSIDFTFLQQNPPAAKYSAGDAYNQAKAANVLTAAELSRRSGGRINAFSLHPGTMFTNITQHPESRSLFEQFGLLTPEGGPAEGVPWKTLAQGAATTVAAAFDPSIEDKAGTYLVDCVAAEDQIGTAAKDLKNASKLWNLTEEVIREKFEFN
ncbi:hypothetical protein FB45DRAFT_1066378 [Roridomyces roridus]|uniref:Short-chain dehydrogenase/reductase n=1 Tax=Roridomyces roridus TaxID=1738132 RepID=A0AAD7B492_9AGAR|nr:hypothetical protein FB45DRAFT_1066378 [Roridomyces roridus]